MSGLRGALTVVFVLGMAGCAGTRIEGAAQPLPGGTQGVALELSNFVFRPNVVTVEVSRRITVTAASKSIAKHNVTIISPEGAVFADVDVPRRETRTFDVTLPRPGTYELYCNVWLHRPLGMKGVLVAK